GTLDNPGTKNVSVTVEREFDAHLAFDLSGARHAWIALVAVDVCHERFVPSRLCSCGKRGQTRCRGGSGVCRSCLCGGRCGGRWSRQRLSGSLLRGGLLLDLLFGLLILLGLRLGQSYCGLRSRRRLSAWRLLCDYLLGLLRRFGSRRLLLHQRAGSDVF